MSTLRLAPDWLRGVPEQTIATIKLAFLHGDSSDPQRCFDQSRAWFGEHPVMASIMGTSGHSIAVTDLMLRPSGFVHMLLVSAPGTNMRRAGRITQRLLELETYRVLSLRGLSAAKELQPMLSHADVGLGDITGQLESKPAILELGRFHGPPYGGWTVKRSNFSDYDEMRPHGALGHLTPREYVDQREAAAPRETACL